MIKRIIQSLAVCSLAIGCLYSANKTIAQEPVETVIVKEVKSKPIKLEIEKVDAPIVSDPVESVKQEPPYFVDIINGYITEESIFSICNDVGSKYDIDPYILQSIAYTESGYYVKATGSSNDSGLCQVVPKWNYDRIERLGITDIYDPYSSILLCADILDELQGLRYGNDISYVLMAYNMGATGAKKPYEAGHISDYARKVLEKKRELELEHGKL